MPKAAMPSGTMERAKLLRRKSAMIRHSLLKRRDCIAFSNKTSSSNVIAVALTRTPENEGEIQDISSEKTFTFSPAGHTEY